MDSSTIESRQQLLNSILYLASLVSDAKSIDSLLDVLRSITALRGVKDFTADDEHKLLELQTHIKQYLISQDPVRRFDQEVLDQKIYEHTAGKNHFAGLRKLLAAIIGAAFAVAGAVAGVMFGGIAPSWKSQPQLPVTAGLAVLYVGALVLFLQVINKLNPQLKKAYAYICVGVMIIVALNVQFAFLTKILEKTWWIEAWGFGPFFAISGCLFYVGMTIFARQFAARSWLVTRKVLIAVLGATAAASALVPHVTTSLASPVYRFSIFTMGVCANLSILSCLIGLHIIRQLAPLYRTAIRLMVAAIGCFGVGAFLLIIIRLAWIDHNNPEAPIALVGLSSSLIVMSGLLFLAAGYAFNKATRR